MYNNQQKQLRARIGLMKLLLSSPEAEELSDIAIVATSDIIRLLVAMATGHGGAAQLAQIAEIAAAAVDTIQERNISEGTENNDRYHHDDRDAPEATSATDAFNPVDPADDGSIFPPITDTR